MPELDKLRRFALAIGLINLAFASAGVRLARDAEIKPLGIPLIIAAPKLLLFVLLVASLYASLRFWFYGYVITESPSAARRSVVELIKTARKRDDGYYYQIVRSSSEAQSWIGRVEKSVARGDATTHEAGRSPSVPIDIPSGAVVRIKYPNSARFLGWLQDVDYSAPLWVNAVALVAGVWRLASAT